jgi:hypothetical protein
MFHLPSVAVIKSYTEEGIHKNYSGRKLSQITIITYMCALALARRVVMLQSRTAVVPPRAAGR